MPYKAGDRIREEYVDAIEYEDTGCEISDKCVECPLPQCKHDDAVWYRRYKQLAKQYDLLEKLTVPFVDYQVLSMEYTCTIETIKRLHKQVLTNSINLPVTKLLFEKLGNTLK